MYGQNRVSQVSLLRPGISQPSIATLGTTLAKPQLC
jgi:hypothetical protein